MSLSKVSAEATLALGEAEAGLSMLSMADPQSRRYVYSRTRLVLRGVTGAEAASFEFMLAMANLLVGLLGGALQFEGEFIPASREGEFKLASENLLVGLPPTLLGDARKLVGVVAINRGRRGESIGCFAVKLMRTSGD
jgi:hypothetical protein